jgi:hypothetical protein
LPGHESHFAAEGILDYPGSNELENSVSDFERIQALNSLTAVALFCFEKELDRGQVLRAVLRLEDFLDAVAELADTSPAAFRSLGNADHGLHSAGFALLYVHAEAPWLFPRSAFLPNTKPAPKLFAKCIDAAAVS